MLIKQWADGQAARHIMDDEDEYQQEPLIPQVHATLDNAGSFGHVIVVPSTMAVIIQTLDKAVCGNISVRYSQLETTESTEEFDEEEQLYTAANLGASRRKYPDADIPLYAISGTQKEKSVLAIVVPHFVNAIAEKAVASQIAVLTPNATTWLCLSPCQLNNGSSISKLDLSSKLFVNVNVLRPPHFITGIGAAVVSALSKTDKLNEIGALALNSEGHPGFEKVDADAIMDATTEVFGEILDAPTKTNALKKLSGVVRKVNSSSTSGMYL